MQRTRTEINQKTKPPLPTERSRRLVRRADGRLGIDTSETDIGDVWAHQRRLQLNQVVADSRKRATRQKIRRERGLVGLLASRLRLAAKRIRNILLGNQPKPARQNPLHGKSVEINISVPEVSLSRALHKLHTHAWRKPMRALRRSPTKAAAAMVVILAASGLLAYLNWPEQKHSNTQPNQSAVQHSSPELQRGTPDYPTLLPPGKSIESLGGWTRVSPPDRDAVYAYSDKIGDVPFIVSQQPLPEDFRHDTAKQVADLAKLYGATEKVSAGHMVIYSGRSVKGPQSAITYRDSLLILIKASAPLKNDQLAGYVGSLQ